LWTALLADGPDPSLVSHSDWLELPLWKSLQPENLTFDSEPFGWKRFANLIQFFFQLIRIDLQNLQAGAVNPRLTFNFD